MKELLTYIVQSLVEKPDEVSVTEHETGGETAESSTRLEIQRVQGTPVWTQDETDPNEWKITLSGVEKYDTLGYEIQYYAVERTVVAAADYDYQAAQYSLWDKCDSDSLAPGTSPPIRRYSKDWCWTCGEMSISIPDSTLMSLASASLTPIRAPA
mgnify:CR=1 FL=1